MTGRPMRHLEGMMEHRERLRKAIDDMDKTETCLDIFDRALAQKDEEISRLKEVDKAYYEVGALNDKLKTELDRVMGEAVGFAGIIKSTRVWAADVEQAIQFLGNPLVRSWRARQGKEPKL